MSMRSFGGLCLDGTVGGVVTHRQRPGTAGGVTFLSLEDAVKLAVESRGYNEAGGTREIPVESIEAAVLDRTRTQQRKFKRLSDESLRAVLDR